MKEIKFKSKKWPLVLGSVLIILLIPLLCTFVSFLFDPEIEVIGKIITVIVGGMFVVLPIICGILAIKSYFDNGKRIREGLAKYGKENLLKNIQDNTISTYKNKVYLTDKLIVDPGQTIIDYNEISLMYKHVSRSRYGAVASIDFELLDGSSWFLCSGIEDQQIQEFMQLCYQHNPKIMFGYTKENLERNKERVTKYKNKEIVIPELEL